VAAWAATPPSRSAANTLRVVAAPAGGP
jgi:hypothetical protein